MEFVLLIVVLLLCLVAAVVAYHQIQNQERVYKDKISQLTLALHDAQTNMAHSQQREIQTSLVQSIAQLGLNQMRQAVVCIDTQRIIRYLNEAALQLIGTSETDTIGKPYDEVLHLTTNEQLLDSSIDSALQGIQKEIAPDTSLTTKRGKIPISGMATPLKTDHTLAGAVLICTDATPLIAAQTEAKAFFSAAAHELRTPLTNIKSLLSLITENFETFGPTKIKELLQDTTHSCDQLIDLVNDFLSTAKIEQGRTQVKKEAVDLITITREVIAQQKPSAEARKLYLRHELGELTFPKIQADKNKIAEILTNLISNAIKYTHQGGITISQTEENGTLVTYVADTGIGIPKESQRLLFQKFMQIGQARNVAQTKSTGLGLFISKRLAKLLGGDVTLENSQPGAGSTFKFYLPL